MREEDDEIQGRDVGPVQVLEHEQDRSLGCPVGEQLQRVLEGAELRAGRLPVRRPRVAERAQGLHERLVGQLRANEIDRVSEQDLEPCVAGACRELGRDPGLADARFSGDEGGRAAPNARRSERALELRELACASDEDVARANHHSQQYCARHPSECGRQSGSHRR